MGSEKWLCCPASAGIFFIKNELVEKFEPSYRFYNQVEEAFTGDPPWVFPESDNITSYDKPLYRTADKFYRGCVAESALWGFHAALDYFNALGGKRREERVLNLSGYLIEGLMDLSLKVNTPREPSNRGGLVSFTTGKHALDVESHRVLNEESIVTALRYQKGVGGIRVSTHFFNTEEEIDRLLKIQKKVLKD